MAQDQAAGLGFAEFGSIGMQGYEAAVGHELYSLQTRMEMLGLPSKHHHHHHHSPEASWRGLFPRHESSSSPGNGAAAFSQAPNEGLMSSADAGTWDQPRQLLVDDSFRCLFPVHDDDQQQSQGLSLSLYKPEPEASPAADFHRSFSQHLTSNLRDGGGSLMFSREPTSASHQQQNLAFLHDREFFPGPAAAAGSVSHRLKLSKYLIPAQDLLNEFCDLGGVIASKQKLQNKKFEEGGPSSNSPFNPSLQTLDILELQKRKAKLLTLLEEVDRRYRRYCEQMRAVVSSFEAVAGDGAATAYLALASKAMSRHFRSLRDGIVEQVQAAKKAMGEKDPVAPGISRGETPRLKVLDQCFRHQKAFQQGGIMEHHPWRPQRGLPERSVSILRAWLFEHFLHPYPSDVDKHILARQTGLSRSQVSNWFINARVRLWKPMIEEMYSEEMKEHEDQQIADGQRDDMRNPKPSCSRECGTEEQKHPSSELLSEPDSLSSIINAGGGGGGRHSEAQAHANPRSFQHQAPVQRAAAENFGVVDIDFSSYSSHSYNGNGVSLTLGLQQHDGGGGGMEFSLSPANQQSIFYSRGQMEDCQPVQFSVLDSEVQNLPYRNLMGAQLLHDLAG